MYEWQKKYWKLLIICALVCLACLFISWIFIAIIAHLGSWIIITIDFISSLFRFIGINNPVGAWFLLGCVIGGNFGLIKSAKIPGMNLKNTDLITVAIAYNLTLILLGYSSNLLINNLELGTEWYNIEMSAIANIITGLYTLLIIAYQSLCWYKIAQKLYIPQPGLAAIPSIGIFYIIYHGFNPQQQKQFIGLLILIGIITLFAFPIGIWLFLALLFFTFPVMISAFFKIMSYLNKPSFFLLLILVPFINLLFLGYLAFG